MKTDNEILYIRNLIYEIRGCRVMIDRDLAALYGVETRVLNQAVKRNIERFPEDFMFQLTKQEFQDWKSQIVISNSVKMGIRRTPYAFTELGVAMLSSVLNSKTAIQINMGIMRAFVAVRQAVTHISDVDKRLFRLEQNFTDLKADLEEIFTDYNDINEDTRLQLELLNVSLAELQANNIKTSKKRPSIGFVPPQETE